MNNKYEGKDNYGNLKSKYLEELKILPREKLLKTTQDMIWLSAYANNNPRSDYHWQVDACYDEWKNREDLDGYQEAFDKVYASR